MYIVSALFVENFEMRQAPGPSARLDITGAMFSMAAPEPAPLTIAPHLIALIFSPAGEPGQGVFEVIFRRDLDPEGEGEPVARNRLVRGELEFTDYGPVFAHCRVDRGPWHVVPFTLLPPVE